MPPSKSIALPQVPNTDSVLLLPLDSRPPCTSMVQELGLLAGTQVTLPPPSLLDNYTTYADRSLLQLWTAARLPQYSKAYIATDLLINGGLLGSRLPLGSTDDEARFLQDFAKPPSSTELTFFSIIPRLLVSDQLIPDAWYQWHLMRYSTLKDSVEQFGDFYFTDELNAITAKIPAEIRDKYSKRYQSNDTFNKNLIALAATGGYNLVIGQDDAQPFGLPNRNRLHAADYMRQQNLGERGLFTAGADEIAQLLVARDYCRRTGYTPKFYIHYARPQMAVKFMPYMSVSVEATLLDKISFIGGRIVDDKAAADVIMFVNCGDEVIKPTADTAATLNELLAGPTPVALLDSSSNFVKDELLLPLLLRTGVPLNRLAAYAAWNTLGNAAGTAAAQAAIFSGQRCRLPHAQQPALYAANLRFVVSRILDDYAYQKLLHARLALELKAKGINPTRLKGGGIAFAQTIIEGFLTAQKQELLHKNLGRTPFYTDASGSYYLQAIDIKTRLPWPRIFEIELQTTCRFGMTKAK